MDIDFSKLENLYTDLIDQIAPDGSLFSTRSREGIFTPALTIWLMISARAKGQRSLLNALRGLASGEGSEILARSESKRLSVTPISRNSGGICRARERLPLELVEEVGKAVSERRCPVSR